MGDARLTRDRIRWLSIIVLIALAIFAARFVDIQALNSSDYTLRAASEMTSTRTMLAARGAITDVNGIEFARSIASVNIVVNQKLIPNPLKAAQIASPILGVPVYDLKVALTGKKLWTKVVSEATPAQWNSLKLAISNYNDSLSRSESQKKIYGFSAERTYTRDYPSGSLLASLLGFVHEDGTGAAGLESSMNSVLQGVDGKYTYESGFGAEIPGSQSELIAAQAGTTVRLTIDRDIQWVAAKAISDAVKASHAISGTVIVMDPKTVQILAHATAPTFDPAKGSSISLDLTRNPSVQDAYEPGSTGKVMTMAAAIEENAITPTSIFTVPYSLQVSNGTFKDHERHPTQRLTTSGILAISSNTGTIKIGAKLDNNILHDYLKKFGVGSSTNSGLPGESNGKLPDVSIWSGTTAPTVAFGQGYSLTAMQATSIFATIANAGLRVSPTVIAGTSDASGHFTPADSQKSTRVVSAETAAKLRLMMESVVSANGTAPEAAIPGYRVAGKTGTAMRVDPACSCYHGYTASFIGMAPTDAPRYVVSVTIQAPQGIHWGGTLGAPVFKKVMAFVLASKHIAPTKTKAVAYPLNEAQLKKAARLAAVKVKS